MLVSLANNTTSRKYLLVDEGISVEEIPSQFSGTSELCKLFFKNLVLCNCCQLEIVLHSNRMLKDLKDW